jgi:hypothetical protein
MSELADTESTMKKRMIAVGVSTFSAALLLLVLVATYLYGTGDLQSAALGGLATMAGALVAIAAAFVAAQPAWKQVAEAARQSNFASYSIETAHLREVISGYAEEVNYWIAVVNASVDVTLSQQEQLNRNLATLASSVSAYEAFVSARNCMFISEEVDRRAKELDRSIQSLWTVFDKYGGKPIIPEEWEVVREEVITAFRKVGESTRLLGKAKSDEINVLRERVKTVRARAA